MPTNRPSAYAGSSLRHPPPESMVADQLDALLGEHLMPLRARTPGSRDEPYLLAVDASGQPVVVEVVAVLDEAALMTALRHAGRAARMSTSDLAEAYSGGPERFASHLAAFRLTVPATALLSTFVRGGARLLLVCSHVSPGAADALEFLLQAGWHVDVLRAQVVTEPDGRRVVELSPVARPTPPRRDVEMPPWARVERPDPLFDPNPLFRAVPRAGSQRWDDLREDRPQADPWERRSTAPATPEPVTVTFAPSRVAPTPAPLPSPVAVPAAVQVAPARAASLRVDPVLVALADALDGPAPLVWCPEGPDGGVCFEAVLQPGGVVELADGTRFGDVEEAARAISGFSGPLDAWDAWRVDSAGGPTLAELARAVFPEQF